MVESDGATFWLRGTGLPAAVACWGEPRSVETSTVPVDCWIAVTGRAVERGTTGTRVILVAIDEVLEAWRLPSDRAEDASQDGRSFADALRATPQVDMLDEPQPVAVHLPFPDRAEVDELGGTAAVDPPGPHHPMTVHVEADGAGGLVITWCALPETLPVGVLRAVATALADLMGRLAGDADWSGPIPALLPPDQRQARARPKDVVTGPWGSMLHEHVLARAAERPDSPAVLWGVDGQWTYAELAERASRIATSLVRSGLAPAEAVAVTLPKGPDQVAAVLGVLMSGGTYVPVGTAQPSRRADRIRRVAGTRVVLDESRLAEAAAGEHAAPLDVATGAPDRAAYVLFTSGSTGDPKGVEVPHAAVTSTLADLIARAGVGPDDRTLAVAALDFDMSVFDIFAPLCAGGAVVMVDEQDQRDAQSWAELVRTRGVTVLNCVPQVLEMLLTASAATGGLGASLREVLVGGDWVPTDLAARLAAQVPGCRFTSFGGATETTIHSTAYPVVGALPEGWASVPYGTPMHGEACRVVDARGRDCPDWVIGELWIGGAGVASGYRGDAERTAQQFVLHEGMRWYRTGDLARYRPGGQLEFVGRRDQRVKVRGFRIELGEVEAALSSLRKVVTAVAGTTAARGGDLVAWVVLGPDPTLPGDAERLREELGDLLPAYMLPRRIILLDGMPLTTNGKVDRRAVRAGLSPGTSSDRTAGRPVS